MLADARVHGGAALFVRLVEQDPLFVDRGDEVTSVVRHERPHFHSGKRQSGLDGSKPGFGNEIAVRRY